MSPDDRVRLRHMADAAESALRFVKGRARADLDADEMLLFALVRAVEIVGEAATKVSVEARAETLDVSWSVIVGMRNRLVHAYFEVDRDIVWTTVTQALPPLLAQLKSILARG